MTTLEDEERFLNGLANDMFGKEYKDLGLEEQQKVKAAAQLKKV